MALQLNHNALRLNLKCAAVVATEAQCTPAEWEVPPSEARCTPAEWKLLLLKHGCACFTAQTNLNKVSRPCATFAHASPSMFRACFARASATPPQPGPQSRPPTNMNSPRSAGIGSSHGDSDIPFTDLPRPEVHGGPSHSTLTSVRAWEND